MYTPYTSSDIKDFLAKHDIYWNEQQLSENYPETDPMMRVNIKTIRNDASSFERYFNEKQVYLEIDNITFKIYAEELEQKEGYMRSRRVPKVNLSLEWTEYLLKKYPSVAATLTEYVKNKKIEINDFATQKIADLQQQIANVRAKEVLALDALEKVQTLIEKQQAND